MAAGAEQQPRPQVRWCWWLGLAGTLLALAGAKLRLIAIFAADLPSGDQWYGELVALYAKVARGEFGLGDLCAAHNEHRIVLTRLLNLALLQLNGHWDPRLQLLASMLVLLAAVGALLWFLPRRLPPLAALAIGALAVLIFGNAALWENTLCGFQSQFYFLLLCGTLHVGLTLDRAPRSRAWWLGHLAGLAALFTMAPGALSAVVVLATLAWRRWCARQPTAGDGLAASWNLGLVVLGAWLLPAMPTSSTASASLAERGQTLLHLLSWPLAEWPYGLLLWAPALALLARSLGRARIQPWAPWLVPWALLALGFHFVILLGRGGIASRYGELFGLGVLVNAVALLTWPAPGRTRWLVAVGAVLWLAVVWAGLEKSATFAYNGTLRDQVARDEQLAVAVRHFVVTGDDELMRGQETFRDWGVAPFTGPLADARMQALLPYSLRPALPLADERAHVLARFRPTPEISDLPVRLAQSGTWRSEWLTARLPLLACHVTGQLAPPQGELYLETESGRKIAPMQARVDSPQRWQRVNFPAPGERFRLVAHHAGAEGAFAFTALREFGRGSWLAPKIARAGSVVAGAGWTLLAAAALWAGAMAWRARTAQPRRA